MGNCLRHESKMHWADEDWDDDDDDLINTEQEHEEEEEDHRFCRDVKPERTKSSDSCHEMIKIRLTKKQLQDLLGKVNVSQDLSVQEQSFSCLNLVNGYQEANNQQKLWRPVLQSIPEI